MKLLTVCSQPEHAQKLITTAQKHGWDIEVIVHEWRGFGTKLIGVYEWLIAHPECEEFVFADAYDVVVFGTPEEFVMKKQAHFPNSIAVFSAEKGCWPNPEMAKYYPQTDSAFKYLNSGLYWCKRSWFVNTYKSDIPDFHIDDQLYFTKVFLVSPFSTPLDYRQTLFNSHSFIAEGEYGYKNGRVQIMANQPVFVHSNGKTMDERLNDLI